MDSKKRHFLYISLLAIALILFFSKTIIMFDKSTQCEMVMTYLPRAEILKESITRFGDFFPLWSPYTMSGTPFFAKADTQGIFSLQGLLLLMIPDTFTALKLTYLLEILIAGIGAYALMYYLLKEHRIAFLSAIIYMFNGWIVGRFHMCHLTTVGGYSILPAIILFVIMAFRKKEWVLYSLIAGILVALQIWMGPDLKVTLWTFPIIALYLGIMSFGTNYQKRAIKAGLILLIVLAVTFGLTAVKILPSKEYIDMSSRSKVSLEDASSRKVHISQIFSKLVEPVYEGMPKIHRQYSKEYNVGIIAFLLASLALYRRWKNRTVFYFGSVALFSILLATGSFVFRLMRLIQPYDSFRYLDRTLVIYVFSFAVLAGYGLYELMKYLKEKKGWKEKKLNLAYCLIIALVILNLMVFGTTAYRPHVFRSPSEMLGQNHALQYLSKQPGLFRIHSLETNGIDWGTEFQYVPLGLSHIYGYESAWLTEYMNEYLGFSYTNPAKFWGILNVKYVTSKKPVNLSGFSLVKRFDSCKICFPEVKEIQKIWGPYVYENNEFVPRAYVVRNSILVLGQKDAAKQALYSIMAQEGFNPRTAVIILGRKNVNEYALEELYRYNAVILTTGSVDQGSFQKLKSYIDNGGILLPDVVHNRNSISNKDIEDMFSTFTDYSKELNVTMHDFDHISLKADDHGFLVYSETFSLYPGWKAKADNKEKEILRADGVISAIMLDNEHNITFEYMPRSFRNGAILSLLTVILIIAYFGYRLKRAKGP